MIPIRVGNTPGLKAATSVVKTPPSAATPATVIADAPEDDPIGGDTPPAPALTGNATLDPTSHVAEPARPRTSGRPGAPIQFSAAAVTNMVASLEQALAPTVTYSEDMNAMRVAAEKQRTTLVSKVLAALKYPS